MKLKCRFCEKKDDPDLMEKGVVPVGYIHKTCISAYLKDKEFKVQERLELDELVDTIIDVHDLESRASIPQQIYPSLQDLRNDSVLFGKIDYKYKEGVTYLSIAETYNYCRSKITWAKTNKQFKNKLSELRYCLVIVRNNIENMYADRKKKAKANAQTVTLTQDIDKMKQVNEIIKNKQNNININKEVNGSVNLESLFD